MKCTWFCHGVSNRHLFYFNQVNLHYYFLFFYLPYHPNFSITFCVFLYTTAMLLILFTLYHSHLLSFLPPSTNSPTVTNIVSIWILDLIFYLCEECHWNFDGNCIEHIDCFKKYSYFCIIDSADLWAWEVFQSSDTILNFFLQWFIVFILVPFHLLHYLFGLPLPPKPHPLSPLPHQPPHFLFNFVEEKT
jgi:hypothetical protein